MIRHGIFREILGMAFDSLWAHKLRSFLTLLGIMIGVMTVIGMVSVISGLNASFLKELEAAGSDLIILHKNNPVRMAIGARRTDILYQFLIESSTISGIGGVIGIVLGIVLAKVVSAATSLPSTVEPVSVIVGVVMSSSLGLFFGIYPANKAAKLDPVDALRSEI